MKKLKSNNGATSVKTLERDLKIASSILEWEMGDIWGHIGVRLPGGEGIMVKSIRPPAGEEEHKDWLVRFDYSGKKISGIGTPPFEASIYTQIFKVRPDVQAIAHAHAPMCIVLSLADRTVAAVHMQSIPFEQGVPFYSRPIHIKDDREGADLARVLGPARAVIIKAHGLVTAGKNIDEACMTALYLERTAKIQVLAHAIGFPGPTAEFVAEMASSKEILLNRPDVARARRVGSGYSYEWRFYANKVRLREKWMRGWT
ncbi:MAG TPA: class II aldolase/adducin family protein [Candidatus Binatia bacterium]|nr:class II aldolase/adducin family protein [Candidatus Binatia bacterium]